jgi:hypothetical protein
LFENDLHRRIARTTTMRALLPAIAFCAVLQATAAVQPAGQAMPAAANKPAAGLLHAKLVPPSPEPVVVAQRVNDGPGKDGIHPATSGTQPASGQEHRPTTAAMLLAALVLMTGIALRRWGAGDQ